MATTRKPILVSELTRNAKKTGDRSRTSRPRPAVKGASASSAKSAYDFVSRNYARGDQAPGGSEGRRRGGEKSTGSSTSGRNRRRIHLVRDVKELARTVRALLRSVEKDGPVGSARMWLGRLFQWLSLQLA